MVHRFDRSIHRDPANLSTVHPNQIRCQDSTQRSDLLRAASQVITRRNYVLRASLHTGTIRFTGWYENKGTDKVSVKVGYKYKIHWRISSECPKALWRAKDAARRRTDMNRVETDTWKTWITGVPECKSRDYRLGDYFQSIQVFEGPAGEPFDMILLVKNGSSSYWKEIAVNLMGVIEGLGASIDFIRQTPIPVN